MRNLNVYAKNVYSQNGEDGILKEILLRLGKLHSANTFVEFGAWDGVYLSNTFAALGLSLHSKAIYIEGDTEKFNDLLDTKSRFTNIIAINKWVDYSSDSKNSFDNILSKEDGTIEKSKIVGDAVGGLAGAAAGGLAGAAIGSAVPIIGTAIGGIIGSILGGVAGGRVGENAGEKVATKFLVPERVAQPSAEKLPEPNIPQSIKEENYTPLIITPPQTFTAPPPVNNSENFNPKEYFDNIVKSDNKLKITDT